jgi:hypothetical protein
VTGYFTNNTNPRSPIMDEKTRAYIYRIVLALIPIATAYGVIAEAEAGLFVGLAAAVLSTGLAAANTSTH